ncbi:hypothetical protein MD484_g7017, partial [Candolleomyces efflorescens]
MSDLPSIRSEVSTTFGLGPDCMSHPLDQARCPSSLSLDVELVGLPTPNQPDHESTDHGVFLDNDTSRYFGVDLSCLSQPDGMNAWTLSLGTGSPLPSVSTSEETPRSGTASTFSSPGNFATTRYLSSDCSSPALSLDYYGLESTVPTPAYRTQATLDDDDIYGDPSPPYEPIPIIPEDDISPQTNESPIVAEEPKSQFKEVLYDMKRFGHKLKRMWKARPTLTLNRNSKAKSEPSASEIMSAALNAQPEPETLPEDDAPDYRSPPGLSELSRIEETEEEDASDGSVETPKIMESRRKLFKPQTMAEIKHIRRRTLPAAPLNDLSSPIGSPIIDIAQRRPRPRSLVLSPSPNFANPADLNTMLVTKTYQDIPTKLDANGRPIRIFVIAPNLPNYPQAKFPGVVVFRHAFLSHLADERQRLMVTGPVERFAGQIASQGYVVAIPSVYHEFEGPEAIPYDAEGTDRGNNYKLTRTVTAGSQRLACAWEATSRASNTFLKAFRAAFHPRVLSSVCWFATDIHSSTLGKGKEDNTLARIRNGDIAKSTEVVMIFGKQDTHVPRKGRDLIRATLEDANVTASFLEVQAQHAFIRDESSKGRWDAALTRSLFTYMLEVFERTVGRDLGPRVELNEEPEHVC